MASEQEDSPELLFFDTFSHDINEELNLDLVQFPKPVYISEVRIIPLGARVQADFPGGVRLGATNPSEFHVDLFVNDLGKPGASTFENLGSFDYNQNDCINLECNDISDESYRQIPTDGLVLRGWYTTITLAVYGTFTKQITEQVASPPVIIQPPNVGGSIVPVQITIGNDSQPIVIPTDGDWVSDVVNPVPTIEPFVSTQPELYVENYENREYQQDEYFVAANPIIAGSSDIPKDPRTYQNPEWNQSGNESTIDRDWDRTERRTRRASRSSERPGSRELSQAREKSIGRFSRSSSREREYATRSKRDWSRSPEYRTHRKIRGPSYDRSRSYDKHERRSPDSDEHRKRPRTPPILSPRRPRTPDRRSDDMNSEEEIRYRSKLEKAKHHEKIQTIRVIDHSIPTTPIIEERKIASPIAENELESPVPPEDETMSTGEQFEPILSDEEIADETESQFDLDYELDDYEDVIKIFNPFVQELQRFEMRNENDGQIPSFIELQIAKEFESIFKLVNKFRTRCDFFRYSDFLNLIPETKECWVHFAEQFIQMMSQFNSYCISRDRNNILMKKLIEDNEISLIISDWIKIGLNFEMSLSQPQPGYKIRHIKAGVRLIEMLFCYDPIAKLMLYDHKFDAFKFLFKLYDQNYMALSIKLMIIKAIHSAIDSKVSMEYFLKNGETNGYDLLIINIKLNPLTRIKFSLKSLIKKINHFESLKEIKKIAAKLAITNEDTVDFGILKHCLNDVLAALTYDEISYTQPKRFLPVSSKFCILQDPATTRSIHAGMLSHYKINSLLSSISIILVHKHLISPAIVSLIYDIIEAMLKKSFGIEYLVDNIETVNLIIKTIFGNDKLEVMEGTRELDIANSIWFKVQTKFYLDAIINLKVHTDQLVEYLHSFYSLTCNNLGKHYVVETICMENNLIPILNLIEIERKSETNRQGSPGIKVKSPVLSYAVDIIDCAVRNSIDLSYLEEYGMIILDLVKNHELFESSVSAMFQELAVYVKPLEIQNVFSYNDITALCELIKRSIEFITTFPGDLIMGLRIIRYLGIPPYYNEDDITAVPEHVELRYKYIILDFNSHDGVATIISIFEKITTFFEQPGIHSSTLASAQGIHVVHILLPAVEILRRMLLYAIKCRNTAFKDLTAIEPIMKVYNLMYHVPRETPCYRDAKKIQYEIIQILLAYTQPSPLEGVDTESVHKSLWTQMIGEVIKYTLNGPHTFIPGLLVFSELLPLPLPIVTKEILDQSEISKLITERQLWSAHLHPQSTPICEMIQTICVTSYPALLLILTRVCLQLADLAPNMTLLVSKSIVDLILNEQVPSSGVTAQLSRLIIFLAGLVCHPSIKVSLLSIMSGKLMDLISSALTTSSSLTSQTIAHEYTNIIIQNLLDSEISMVSPNGVGSREMTLACALPAKEIILSIANAVTENFMLEDLKPNLIIIAMRTILFLTEHDFTIYHLRTTLDTKTEKFYKTLKKICELPLKENAENIQIINSIIEFLLSLITLESEIDPTNLNIHIPLRTIILTPQQFGRILSWKLDETNEDHFLRLFKSKLENEKTTLVDENTEVDGTHLKIEESMLENISRMIEYLEKQQSNSTLSENSNTSSSDFISNEPILPQAEGIVTQYASRQFYVLSTEIDERLRISYWLSQPTRDLDENVEVEQINCDLNELIKSCLSAETNITSECKRLLHLSASPQATRERATTAPCYRTRRVEVEPSTGRPEKKLYITPMRGRGFPRTPPSRGDLFRSRPPNTSRPPSLHVDDFLALETCGAQPTGPTGYNKLSRDIISIRGGRGRGRGFNSDRGRIPTVGTAVPSPVAYRQTNPWPGHMGHMSGDPNLAPPQHFRTATSEPVVSPHFPPDPHYPQAHFGGPMRGRIARFARGRPFAR